MARVVVHVSTSAATAVRVSYQNYASLAGQTATVPANRPANANLDLTDGGEVAAAWIGTDSADCPDAAAWEAPEIAGCDFRGWYTLDADRKNLVIPKSAFGTRLAGGRATTWGALKAGMRYAKTAASTRPLYQLRLVYEARTVRVDFSANMGTGAPASRTATFGTAFAFPAAVPTRERYRFLGWAASRSAASATWAAGETAQLPGELFAQSAVTVYAVWEYAAVVAVLDPQGGTVTPRHVCVRTGSAYGTLPTPVRAGFVFGGWFTAATGGTAVTAATVCGETAAHTLYAHWTAGGGPSGVWHTVRLEAFGGSVSPASVSVEEGSAYGTLPTPTRAGHVFGGWYTAANGGTEVTAATTVEADEDHALYARWTATTVVVTFDANGGSCPVQTKGVAYGKAVGRLPAATLAGKVFAGWYTAMSGGTEVTATTRVTASATVYARWDDQLDDGGYADWEF